MPSKTTVRNVRSEPSKAAHYNPYLSVYEAADYTGYHWQTVRKEIVMRNIAASRGPGKRSSYKIRLSELNRWMGSRETKISKVRL